MRKQNYIKQIICAVSILVFHEKENRSLRTGRARQMCVLLLVINRTSSFRSLYLPLILLRYPLTSEVPSFPARLEYAQLYACA